MIRNRLSTMTAPINFSEGNTVKIVTNNGKQITDTITKFTTEPNGTVYICETHAFIYHSHKEQFFLTRSKNVPSINSAILTPIQDIQKQS